jgi:hypothetical protein
MSEQIAYGYYKKLVKEKINFTDKEESEIVKFMYDDGWKVKDTINHIESVRSFNKNKKGE